MNNIDKQYQNLVCDILVRGNEKNDRTGTGTVSVFGCQIRHKMSEGFPLLTTKKLSFKNIWTELVWFLSGSTNIKYLVENGNNIWVGDAYKKYTTVCSTADSFTISEFTEKIKNDDDFSDKWGDMGKIYGHNWRNFAGKVDQIENILSELKHNPDSRRLLVAAWNPSEHDDCVLPPCHYGFQVYTRELANHERLDLYDKKFNKNPKYLDIVEKITHDTDFEKQLTYLEIPKRAISLMWNQRSADVGLGLPYNIASYALLLIMISKEVGMVPDELIGNLGDAHIYKNHIEGLTQQIHRNPFELPTVSVQNGIHSKHEGDFKLVDYKSHPKIHLPLSN